MLEEEGRAPKQAKGPAGRGPAEQGSAGREPLDQALIDELLRMPDAAEAEHRRLILEAIQRKLEQTGAHNTQPGAARARQFMPFAALKGYAEMVQQVEDEE